MSTPDIETPARTATNDAATTLSASAGSPAPEAEPGSGDDGRKSGSSTIADFLGRVVPWPADGGPGFVNIHWRRPSLKDKTKVIWTGKPCGSLPEFQSNIAWGLTQASILDIYFCLSMQAKVRTSKNGTLLPERTQADAMSLKAIWLDVDVKDPPKGYNTIEEALAEIDTFVAKFKLPAPSALIGSGGGVHVYWISHVPLTPAEWLPYADGLKAAAMQFGLRCDYGVTTDCARVLRVPGTFNYKTEPRRPVTLISLLPQDYNFECDLKALHDLAPVVSDRILTSPSGFDLTNFGKMASAFSVLDPTESLAAGIEQYQHPPLDWDPLVKIGGCAFIREALRTGGKEYTQPMWNLTTLAATFLEDGEKLAHRMGNKHPGYSKSSTDALWDRKLRERKEKKIGWPSCAAIHSNGCSACASCPHFGKIKSPLHLTAAVPANVADHADAGLLADASTTTWNAAGLHVSFSNIPHRRWLYGTYLIRGELTVLAAPGGAGKTALATGVSVELASGQALLGEQVWNSSDQKVLYLNGEDSSTEIKRRLFAFAQQHQLAEQDLARLYVAGADDPRVQSLSFLCANEKGTMVNQAGFAALETALETVRPDLLVLDPLVVFCGGGNMNDNAVMAMMVRKLKALAVRYDCATLIVHHTRKGKTFGDVAGEAEAISGAAAIVNLSRRALMPATMTDAEAKSYNVLPSERLRYFKLADAKSNLAPLSAEAPWYELASVELPNPEPPTYPNGDRVQAVKRADLTRLRAPSSVGPQELAIKFELMKLVDRGRVIDGEQVPFSPNSTGNNKQRAVLDDAMAAVERATPDRQWLQRDLRATVERELEALKHDGWVVVEPIKKGRFRRLQGLRSVWERTPWAQERQNLAQHGGPTVRTQEEEQELERSDAQKFRDELLQPDGQSVNEVGND